MNSWSPRAEATAAARVAATPCKTTVLFQNICQRQCDPSRVMRFESPTFSCGRLMPCVSDATALPHRITGGRRTRSLDGPGANALPVITVKLNKTSKVSPGPLGGRLDFGTPELLSHRDFGQAFGT
jgi:hypothetical protein